MASPAPMERQLCPPGSRWVLALALGLGACAGEVPSTPPPTPPAYKTAFEEVVDLPKQMSAQADWALEPITRAEGVAQAVADARADLDIDPEVFSAASRAAFEGKPIPETRLEGLSPDERARLDELCAELGKVRADLASVPRRTATAGTAIAKIGIKAPMLVRKAVSEVKANPALAARGAKDVMALPKELRALGPKLRKSLKKAPEQTANATAAIMAAIGGKAVEDATEPDAAVVHAAGEPVELEPADLEAEETEVEETEVEEAEVEEAEFEEAEFEDPGPNTAESGAQDEIDDPIPAAAPARRPDEDRPDVRPFRLVGYSLIALGTGLSIGLVTGGYKRGSDARVDYLEAFEPDDEVEAARRYESGRAMIIAGAVTGSLAGAAGITLVIVDAFTHRRGRVAAAPWGSSAGAGLAVGGRF